MLLLKLSNFGNFRQNLNSFDEILARIRIFNPRSSIFNNLFRKFNLIFKLSKKEIFIYVLLKSRVKYRYLFIV
jgi:hypothetical protein